MNKLLYLLYFLPTLGFAQYDNLVLENKHVYFEKVYVLDSLPADKVQALLITSIPRIKGVKGFSKNDEMITAQFDNCFVDYKRYGGRFGNIPPYLGYPMTGEISILWKEGRFKVLVSNIVWHTVGIGDFTAEDAYTKRSGSEWATSKTATLSGTILEKFLSDLFLPRAPKKNDW